MKSNPLTCPRPGRRGDILPFQPEFRPALPTVHGNVDYRRFEELLKRVDEILRSSGLENLFVRMSLADYRVRSAAEGVEVKNWMLARHQRHSRQALRCEVLRKILGADFRGMSCRLAECPLFQWFCQIDALDAVKVPGKSVLQAYAYWLSEEQMRQVINTLLRAATEKAQHPLELADPLDLDAVWLDTTCVKANIHFPVDWVLLRDAVRTLMKAVTLIRRHGLRHRMSEPATFIRRINTLSMEMSAARRQSDSRRQRKRVLRRMKQLTKVVAGHARRYRRLLDAEWEGTDWTRKQAEQVLRRIDGVLQLLPQAVKQAHERIIGGRAVANDEKILSLYEPDLHVIVRGKADAEVEFGNQLLLTEQRKGFIVDWVLEEEKVSSNAQMVKPCLQRIRQAVPKVVLRSVGTDRGFASEANSRELKKQRIFDGICPKGPGELQRRLRQPRFVLIQKRRAQTEGRIGIFQNVFLGQPFRAKGFAHRELAVAWSVLAHNLWVLARLPTAEVKKQEMKLAA
jgi:hypothetical protein